jgi:hypothetical protein
MERGDMMSLTATPAARSSDEPRCRVRVWFGQHVMCSYTADQIAAQRYAAAMARRFPGLRVSVDELTEIGLRPLPCELLWTIAP